MQESPDQLRQRNRMLEDRVSKLCAAVLRASASLDLETVLREIVDSARALTGARYGMITTVDDAGQPQDWVISGWTADEQAAMGRVDRSTEAVRALPGPSRAAESGRPAGLRPGARLLDGGDSVEDAAARAGPPTAASTSATSSSARRRADRSSRAPTRRSWSCSRRRRATAIANAPHVRQRAAGAGPTWRRWFETCPVGVVVFDGKSGRPVSFNRERRGGSPSGCARRRGELEELLDVVHLPPGRRARGPPLAQSPMAQQLSNAETVRAEEITLSVPGRPQRHDAGQRHPRSARRTARSSRWWPPCRTWRRSRELERQRAEFLSMVSHELRDAAELESRARRPPCWARRPCRTRPRCCSSSGSSRGRPIRCAD